MRPFLPAAELPNAAQPSPHGSEALQFDPYLNTAMPSQASPGGMLDQGFYTDKIDKKGHPYSELTRDVYGFVVDYTNNRFDKKESTRSQIFFFKTQQNALDFARERGRVYYVMPGKVPAGKRISPNSIPQHVWFKTTFVEATPANSIPMPESQPAFGLSPALIAAPHGNYPAPQADYMHWQPENPAIDRAPVAPLFYGSGTFQQSEYPGNRMQSFDLPPGEIDYVTLSRYFSDDIIQAVRMNEHRFLSPVVHTSAPALVAQPLQSLHRTKALKDIPVYLILKTGQGEIDRLQYSAARSNVFKTFHDAQNYIGALSNPSQSYIATATIPEGSFVNIIERPGGVWLKTGNVINIQKAE
jgi:hypothetical protein